MNTQIRKNTWFYVVLASILLVSMACSMGGISVSKDSASVTITLTEDQMNTILERATTTIKTEFDQYRLLDEITSVNMQDGVMTVHGKRNMDDGSQVDGSYAITMGAANGILQVAIQDVNIPGVEATKDMITKVNQIIQDELTKSVKESNGEVSFEDASITSGKLSIKVKVNFKK
jgi:hypothetical protein